MNTDTNNAQPRPSSSSVTIPLLDLEYYRNPYQVALQKYLAMSRAETGYEDEPTNLVDLLLSASTNTLPRKLDRVYEYAANSDYYYGVPLSNGLSDLEASSIEAGKTYLNSLEGQTVIIRSALVGYKNLYFSVWEELFNLSGYNGNNNELTTISASKGTPCYLESVVIEVTESLDKSLVLVEGTDNYLTSFKYGKCFGRLEDFNRLSNNYIVTDRNVATVNYAYEVPLPDTTKPSKVIINSFTEGSVTGYAEVGTTVNILSGVTVIANAVTGSDGGFNITVDSGITSLSVVCVDASGNRSDESYATVGYVNSNPASSGPTVVRETEVIIDSYEIPLTDIVALVSSSTPKVNSGWLQMLYSTTDGFRLFSYNRGSGAIKSIDNSSTSVAIKDKYLPKIYLRHNAVNTVNLSETNKKKIDTRKILKYLSLDLEELSENILGSITNMSNDYKYVCLDMYCSLGKAEDNNLIAGYGYYYINKLYTDAPAGHPAFELPNPRNPPSMTIWDGYTGTVIDVPTVGSRVVTGVAKKSTGEYLKVGEYVAIRRAHSYQSPYYSSKARRVNATLTVYIHQVTSTSYREIQLLPVGTFIRFDIGNKIWSAFSNVEVPVDLSYLDTLSVADRDIFTNMCFKVSVVTYTPAAETSSSWYNSSFFKAVTAIISSTINFSVPGAGSTLNAFLNTAAQVATGVLIDIVINAIIKLAVDIGVSADIVKIFRVVASIAATSITVNGINAGVSLAAPSVMSALNSAFNTYEKMSREEIANIIKEMDEFKSTSADKQARLEEAQSLLNTGIVPLDLNLLKTTRVDENLLLVESAEDFYTRTTTVDVSGVTTNIVDYFIEVNMGVPTAKPYRPPNTENVEDILLIK